MTLQEYFKKTLLTTEYQDIVTKPSVNGPYFMDSSSQYIKDSQVSTNVSEIEKAGFSGGVGTIFIAVSLGIFILITLIGNVFVIVAICTEKNLKCLANKLILSLAVADFMVATLVMPLSAVNEVTQQVWAFGPEVCMLWTSLDVLCCTSSILHLLAIAIDRYWAVTDIEYARSRSKKKIYLLIIAVWVGSSIVSFAPVFGWKDPDFYRRLETEGRCLVSQNVIYQVFATCTSFYIPLIFILLLYWNIFKQARKRIRSKPGAAAVLIEKNSNNPGSSTSPQSIEDQAEENRDNPQGYISENGVGSNQPGVGRLIVLAKREKKHVKESTEAKRERKAAKTLMIITGVFIFCWLPFFVMALLMAVCSSCEPDGLIFSILLWLGYTNSLLNPIIYTVFSPDFRNAFKRMLCGAQYVSQRH